VEELLDPDKCIHCGLCAQGCYSGARRTVGRWMSPEEVMEQVAMDRGYYAQDGGLTVTGGEPTLQPAFVGELLTQARAQNIHCAMESNLLTSKSILDTLLPKLDLLMCDIKLWNSEAHRQWTGTGNETILDNIRYAGRSGVPMLVRIPVVSGVNDDGENIRNTARFLAQLPHLICLELLPYHPLGLSKHLASGVIQQAFQKPTRQKLNELAEIVGSYRIPVRIANVSA
jgi:pyruvate formate lyase activating enzyme